MPRSAWNLKDQNIKGYQMRTRQEFNGIFIKQYTKSTLPILTPEQLADVEYQLENRYFTNNPQFKPTEREQFWGITECPPGSTYWVHFRLRLNNVIETLSENPTSNHAVITIDYPPQRPCYQCFQFKIKNGVEMTCFARSLDLDNGLPVDANIFWKVGVEVVSKALKIHTRKGVLNIISVGAHNYVY